MNKELTASEMGKKGGKSRWKGISKKKRSQQMTELIKKRWAKKSFPQGE